MAVYRTNNNNNHESSSISKKIGILILVLCSICFVALFTKLIMFLRIFLLGTMGLFAYPFFITTFIVGLALINNRRYVMNKRYIFFMVATIVSLLAVIQMLIIGTPELSFFEYIAYTYTKQITAGGAIVSIFIAPILYLLGSAGVYIIYSILAVVFGALMIDYLYYAKDQSKIKKSVKIIEDPVKVVNKPKTEPINIVLNGNIDSEKKTQVTTDNIVVPVENKPKSRKEYLLTPPEVNLNDFFFHNNHSKNEINRNIDQIKNDAKIITNYESDKKEFITNNSTPSVNNFNIDKTDNDNDIIINKPAPKPEPIKEEPSILENVEEPEKEEKLADKILRDILQEDKNDKIDIKVSTNSFKPEKKESNFTQLTIDNETSEKQPEVKKSTLLAPYKRPPIDLLTTESMDLSIFNEDTDEKRTQLENALEMFGIPAKVIGVVVGPSVTRYELEMPPGISVKKVLSHTDDIALALASNGNIRIEAPIPGKSAVGIEVPNNSIATIGLRDIIKSTEFNNSKSPIIFSLGKDISGNVRLCNLQKMPHLLVAGSTGSGKSVCLNSIIMSFIYKASPDDVKLLLIDPKRVEFSMFNGLPHLLVPNVITEPDKVVNAFNYAVDEMERRYKLFQSTRTKNIEEFNNSDEVLSGKLSKIPFIVMIVDELADLMVTMKKDIEDKIMRLAQKSRAAGIHLILATQRPSVDVITGTIKINFPSRIAFAVASFADSKTVLDQGGAEKLLGKGDMLYAPSDMPEPKRVQGCFVTTKEIDNVVEYVKQNNKYEFDSDIDEIINPKKPANDNLSNDLAKPQQDPLLPEVLKYFIESGQASITMIQRRFIVGFPRASRIIDQMERAKYISPPEGSKPRVVYITMEQYEEIFGKESND